MSGDGTASAGTAEADSLIVNYDYAADMGRHFSTIAEALDGVRRSAYNALGDATADAGFPGLGAAIAAFGDSANGHLSTVASNIAAISGTIGTFSSNVRSADTSMPNPMAGLIAASSGSSSGLDPLLTGPLTGAPTPPTAPTGTGVTIAPGVTIGGS